MLFLQLNSGRGYGLVCSFSDGEIVDSSAALHFRIAIGHLEMIETFGRPKGRGDQDPLLEGSLQESIPLVRLR